MSEITPFTINIPQAELDDLDRRLDTVRFPGPETVADRSQGLPLATIKDLHQYWQRDYDWRACETRLNGLGQWMTTIDGLPIHFLHVRSPHEHALPLLLTNGWPGSIIELLKVIEPLTRPELHGGNAADAFHLVIPSLPGYGFSGKPRESGWNV